MNGDQMADVFKNWNFDQDQLHSDAQDPWARTQFGHLLDSCANCIIDGSKNKLTVPYYPKTPIGSPPNSFINEAEPDRIYFWFNKIKYSFLFR